MDSDDSPQRGLLRRNVSLEQMDQETVGLEMTPAPVGYSSSMPSEADPVVEIKQVSGCLAGVAGSGVGEKQVEAENHAHVRCVKRWLASLFSTDWSPRPDSHVFLFAVCRVREEDRNCRTHRSRRETEPVH